MTNHIREKTLGPNISVLVLLMTMLLTAVTGTTRAKSLYIIADIDRKPTPLQAYNIAADGTLTFQAEYGIPYHGSYGAMGLAIDSDSKTLFVTYERSDVIQLINATTMTGAGVTRATDANDLAGIVYDHDKGLLYCVDRYTDKLYVYDWQANTATLTQVPGSPFSLTGATAFGIALDEINDLLYVANASTTINVYNTSDWSSAGTISVSRASVGIAIDYIRGLIYCGGTYPESSNYYLIQYNLATGKETSVQVEPDAGVFGIAVDQATGLIYVGTGANNRPGGDNLQVYDTSLNEIDTITEIGNPTGLVIPIEEVSYNPLNLYKNIAGTTAGEIEHVEAGGTITYTICFDNKNNDYTVNNVSIVDILPDEVSFVTADGNGVFGQYDPITHTYRWSYSSLSPGFSGACLKLVAQVNQATAPGATITNSVAIDSDKTGPTTVSVDAVIEAIHYTPLNLSKNIIGGTIGKETYVSVGDTIIYGICFDNKGNDYTVTNISIVDSLPDEVSFVTADGDGVFGQYDPIAHVYTWTYPSLSPRSSGDCLQLVVQVNYGAAPGATITNSVTIDSNETGPTKARVGVVAESISYNPLNLSKSIIGGDIEQNDVCTAGCVGVGDTIIYGICFDNKNNGYTVNNVSIIDILPHEVSFVTADGNGVFGQYDAITHTYRWSYSSLPPGFPGACLTLVAQVNQGTAPGTTITNFVTVDSDETRPATASIGAVTRQRPLKADLTIRPNMIRRNACCTNILAIVGLPQGIRMDDIENEPLILNPGGVEASYQLVFDTAAGVEVHAWFDPAGLKAAVPGYGEVRVQVIGKLKSGQPFIGEDIIYITKFVGN